MEMVIPAMQADRCAKSWRLSQERPKRQQMLQKNNNIPNQYGTHEELFADQQDVDAVYIPLPSHLHDPCAIKAGKHALCEKPIRNSSSTSL